MTQQTGQPSVAHVEGNTIISSPGVSFIIPGMWSLGEAHETGNFLSIPLLHTSLDEPVFVWTLTKEEVTRTEPERLVWQIPQGLRQRYVPDQAALEKSLARVQLKIKKPWKAITDKASKLRLTGDKQIFIDEIAPHIPSPQPYGSESDLFNKILAYLTTNVVFSDGIPYIIVTAWILMTWRIEDTDVAPYLYVTAPRGNGKTRLLETLEQVVYRPLMAAYATRAGLIRALDGTCATVLLDEGEHYINPMQRGNTELIAVLNSGNRRGSYTIMVADITETDPDGTKRTVKKPIRLDTYSAKCIVSRKPIFDTLEDRSIQIVMPKADHKLPPIDKTEAEAIRGHLAEYRRVSLEQKHQLRDEGMPETGDARLDDTIGPLFSATPSEYRGAYETLILREQETRFARMRESYEFSIMEAFSEVVEAADPEATLILTETITDAYNRHHATKLTTAKSVGSALTRLGFRSIVAREQEGGKGGKWLTRRGYRLNREDRDLLKQLRERYGLAPPEPVSLVSVESPCKGYSPIVREEKYTPHSHDTTDTTDTSFPKEAPKPSEGGSKDPTEHTAKLTSYAWQRDHPKDGDSDD